MFKIHTAKIQNLMPIGFNNGFDGKNNSQVHKIFFNKSTKKYGMIKVHSGISIKAGPNP